MRYMTTIMILTVLAIFVYSAIAFEKTEHFTNEVDPLRLDRELRRIADAIDDLENEMPVIPDEILLYLYCDTGDQVIAASDAEYLIFTDTLWTDSIYKWIDGNRSVGIGESSLYEVCVEVSAQSYNDTPARGNVRLRRYSDAWDSLANIDGSWSYFKYYGAENHHTVSLNTIIWLDDGDSVAVIIEVENATDSVKTNADGSRMIIKQLQWGN